MGADGMKMKESWTAWVEHLRDPDGRVNLLLAAAEHLDRRDGGGRAALDRAKRDQIRAELYDDGYLHLGLKLVRGNYTTRNGFRWGYDAWNTHTVRAEGPFCPTNQTTVPAREGDGICVSGGNARSLTSGDARVGDGVFLVVAYRDRDVIASSPYDDGTVRLTECVVLPGCISPRPLLAVPGADLRRLLAPNAVLHGLRSPDLSGANLAGSYLLGADLCGANLSQANLREACLVNVPMARANLAAARFSHADMLFCDMSQALAANADLRHADLRHADLRHADLRHADLRAADLRGADLRHADLRGANLWGADLRHADLRGANLRHADLRGANLWGASMEGASLHDAIVDVDTLNGAVLPEELRADAWPEDGGPFDD